ncbi:FAD-dependent oxidoreductase [Actinoallomurus iriomotensis]|uniref:Phytoene dehydrogenase n=1 Tax=Actinoallomurus iriomotensis TaxID=478107 RepID=A0A9W6RS20_9ACTN|nr:FAD-dependent oxidoreductase [Actinoallomurus iriomotensis]GLY80683.1 phytoene dehydrogenase [Actinoallomurus iriomotensis]
MRIVAGPTDHVVVVGAGLSGLAAALHLCGRGRSVTVLERAAVPGGRVGRRDVRGHRLDTGPAVLTMPDVVEETLGAVGVALDDRLTLTRLDPICRAYLPDGSALDVRAGRDAVTEALRAYAGPREAARYGRLRDRLARLCRAPYTRLSGTPALLPGGFGHRFPRAEPSPALAAVAAMDAAGGAWFPHGGMRALPDALAGAAAGAGVDLRHGTTVSALERHGRRVIAAHTTGGERIPCDAIVLACAPATARRLLGHAPSHPYRAAPSAVVVHLSATGDGPAHHNLLFGDPASDTPLLVTRPTATDPALAPGGRQILSVSVPLPRPGDGAKRAAQASSEETVALVAARCGLSGVETLAAFTADGAEISGPALARTADNVVFAGHGAIPGLDVPTALLSGRPVADRVTGTPVPRPRPYAGITR